jgi:hypothetical protein
LVETRLFCHSQNGSAIITVTVVLHGCETWSITLRKEHRPRRTI